jgi:hypothetical protein
VGTDVDSATVSCPEVSLRSPSIHTYSHTRWFRKIMCDSHTIRQRSRLAGIVGESREWAVIGKSNYAYKLLESLFIRVVSIWLKHRHSSTRARSSPPFSGNGCHDTEVTDVHLWRGHVKARDWDAGNVFPVLTIIVCNLGRYAAGRSRLFGT